MNADSIAHSGRASLPKEVVLELLREILGDEPVDINASFFSHGGDSLLFLMFLSRLNERLAIEMNSLDFDGDSPLISLIETLEQHHDRPIASSIDVAIDLIEESGAVPVTANRYSYLSRMGSGADEWSLPSQIFQLDYRPDSLSLQAAAETLVARHDGLRFDIARNGQEWTQTIGAGSISTRSTTYDGLFGDAGYDGFLEREIDAACAQLKLAGPKATILLVISKNSSGSHLVLIFHHAFIDGVALSTLENELLAILRGGPDAIKENPGPTSYVTYAREQLPHCASLIEEGRIYWGSLPWDQIRPFRYDQPDLNTEMEQRFTVFHERYFDGNDFDRASQFMMRSTGVALSTLLISSLASAYGVWTGEKFLHLDLAHHGRSIDSSQNDFSETVGWINQTAPMIIPTSGALIDIAVEISPQINAIAKLASTFTYCRYLCDDESVAKQFRQYPEATISLNILTAPQRRAGLNSVTPVYPFNRLPKRGRRVHQLSGGIVREAKHLKLALDHNSKAIDPVRVRDLLEHWGDALSSGLEKITAKRLAHSSTPL